MRTPVEVPETPDPEAKKRRAWRRRLVIAALVSPAVYGLPQFILSLRLLLHW